MLADGVDFPLHIMELANAAAVISVDGETTSFSLEEFEQRAGTMLEGALGVTSITGVSLEASTFANYTLYSKTEQLLALSSHEVGASARLDLTAVSAVTALHAVTELVEKWLI